MNTSATLPASLNNSSWFQTVARMDAPAINTHSNLCQPAPAITGQTFAELRQEAAGLKPATTRTSRNNAKVSISFDTVRFTASTHFRQRTTRATA